MELIPDFHWIKGLGSNIYLWMAADKLVLVDTGIPGDYKRISNYLGDIGCSTQDIGLILITHADYDHAGSAAALQAASGARIIASEKSVSFLKIGHSPPHSPPLVQRILNLIKYPPVPEEAIDIINDGEFVDGLPDWNAVASPGHSDDHFSYMNFRDGILFAGDALFSRGQLDLGRSFVTGNEALARESAVNLLKLAPGVICCGHGAPIIDHLADDIMILSKRLHS